MMKIFQVNLWVLILILAFGTVGCKNDDDSGNANAKTEYLTANPWKIVKVEMNPGYQDPLFGLTITDFTPFMEACDKDDQITFNVDQTVLQDEGATKCDDSEPQTVTGTWAFLNDETQLASIVNGVTETYDIVQLESGIFVGSQLVTNPLQDGVDRTLTVTFEPGI